MAFGGNSDATFQDRRPEGTFRGPRRNASRVRRQTLPEIAKELGVANILEGTVQKAGGQVRVNVQLAQRQRTIHIFGQKNMTVN